MIGDLRTLLLFYRRHLRVQPLRELMAVAGVAAGVALLFAVQVATAASPAPSKKSSTASRATRRSKWPPRARRVRRTHGRTKSNATPASRPRRRSSSNR